MLVIGRALMARPKLLLLDEPSLGLSPRLVSEVFDMIRSLAADGQTVLLVEQNVVQGLKVADRGYMLTTGGSPPPGTRPRCSPTRPWYAATSAGERSRHGTTVYGQIGDRDRRGFRDGRRTAVRFAEEGALVTVADIDEAGGKATVEEIRAAGGTARLSVTDVSVPDSVRSMVDGAVECVRVTGRVAQQRVLGAAEPHRHGHQRRGVGAHHRGDATGVFPGCKYAVPAMLASGEAHPA